MALGKSFLSKFKEVFTYDDSAGGTVIRRFALTIESDESGESDPTAAICGAADLILRVESLAQNVPGGRVSMLTHGHGGSPLTCDSGRTVLKLEARARSEEDISYLSELLFEEARMICAKRRLVITEEHISEVRERPEPFAEDFEQAAEVSRQVFGRRAAG